MKSYENNQANFRETIKGRFEQARNVLFREHSVGSVIFEMRLEVDDAVWLKLPEAVRFPASILSEVIISIYE